MTEKRFEIDSKMYGATDIRYYLKDNANELVDGYGDEIYWGDGSTNGLKQIVNKLNELHEEKIELHIQNDFLKDENQHMRDLVNENKQLKKENKKLKQSDNDAWNLIRFIYNEIKEDGYMDWGRIQDLVEFEYD